MPERIPFKTVKDFENRVAGYFEECRAAGTYPDEAGLILHLGLEREAYEGYQSGAEGKGYAACLRKAKLRRESIIVRDIYGTDKASTGKIFLARQESNGGLSDKPRDETGGKKAAIEVRINGGYNGEFD
jgi:hypothetical protein